MRIKFKPCQRKRIRKFLPGCHGKKCTDLSKIFTAIAYLVYTGCQWKMLPRYYPPPGTVYFARCQVAGWWNAQTHGSKIICDYVELSVLGPDNDISCRDAFHAPVLLTDYHTHHAPDIYLTGRKIP